MNKSELIKAVALKNDISKAAAARAVDVFIETITNAVAKGEDVTLVGFGTFKQVKRGAREGRNPRTGEALNIASARVPKFAAGATFKAAVNK